MFASALLALAAAPVTAQAPPLEAAQPKPAKPPKPGKSEKTASKSPKPAGPKPAEPLFASSEIINLTITAPFGTLTQARDAAAPPVAGSLRVAGSPDVLAITLAPRGITRRKRETCPFPPLWLEFSAKPPAASLFKGQKKLKLVTHCRSPEAFQQYVLLEYAAYRLYNVLTPTSFRTRLARIDYVDPAGKPVASRIGFFIEDGGEVAKRNQMEEFKGVNRIRPSQLAHGDAARFAMFQNMIGNLDWAMTAGPPGSDCCHNSRLMTKAGATTALVPTPYDFDFSGFVDAPYAVPPDSIKVASVRVRRFRGYCIHNAELPAMAAFFNEKRPQLLAVTDEVPLLDAGTRSKARKYLEGFFEQTASPDTIADKFAKPCL
jgi:hypothetical protein